MKKLIKTILGFGTKRIILGVAIALVVISGVSVGIYFGVTKKDDQAIKSPSSKKEDDLDVLKISLSTFTNEELKDFIVFLNYKYEGPTIPFVNNEKEINIDSIIEFYKKKTDFEINKEKEIIDNFKLVYSQRKEFLAKKLDTSIKNQLREKFQSLEIIKYFARSTEIHNFESIASINLIIDKIIDKWNLDLYNKTREIPLWENFINDLTLFKYAKELDSQIDSFDKTKNLDPTNLYTLHYNSWAKYYENLISSYILNSDLTNLLSSYSALKIELFVKWINSEKNTTIELSNNDENKNAIIDYYINKDLDVVNQDVQDFERFFEIWQTYRNKQLEGIEESLKTKFTNVDSLKQFAYKMSIGFSKNDSFDEIIFKIIETWNTSYKNQLDTIPVWENFINHEELFNQAINKNDNLNYIDDIKELSPLELYQVHYKAWIDYYKGIIKDYILIDYLRLPYSVENSIRHKIIEKYGSSLSDFAKYEDFMQKIGDRNEKRYNEIEGIELKDDYSSLTLKEILDLIFSFIFQNYEQYTRKAYNELVNGVGIYKLFDKNDPIYKAFGLIGFVDKTLEELKDLETNTPQEFFQLYKQAWIDKINNDIDNIPYPINKAVNPNSLMQKDNPQRRNNRRFSCDYSLPSVPNNGLITKDNWVNPSLNNQDEVDDVIVCALLESSPASTPTVSNLNNDFPLIVFNNINNDLVNQGIDPKKYNDDEKKASRLTIELNARIVAKIISEKLFESLSFSGEIANLDAIIFNQYDSSRKDIEYTQSDRDFSVKPFSSWRAINVFLQNRDENGVLRFPNYTPFNNERLKRLSFDLYGTFEAIVRGYGYHVTLQNHLFDSQKLLDELKNVFDDEGNNQAFNDFVEMYKYFNSMNSDNNLNFKDSLTKDASEIDSNELSLNEGAINALKLFRKYYSYNVRTVYDLIYSNLFSNLFTESENIDQVLYSLNSLKAKGMENPTLITYLEELKNGDETNKEKLKDYYLSYYNKNSLFKTPPTSGGTITKYSIKYAYVPDSYDLDSNRDPQLQVKDIFPNMKAVDWNWQQFDNKEIGALSCLDLGYNFHGGSINYDQEKLLANKFTTEQEFKDQSIKTDKDILKSLQYYFSYEELLARMYSVFTNKNVDKRKYIDQCSFDSSKSSYPKSKLALKNKNFEDYGFFRSFGMNLLKGNNEKNLYAMLSQKGNLNNNEGYIYKNKIRKSSAISPNPNGEDEVPYSLSLRVTNSDGNDVQGWSNINLIVDLELDNPEDAFLVKFRYKKDESDSDSYVVSPVNYDYYNAFFLTNDVDENIESVNNRQITSLYSSASDAKKHVTLVFKLWEIIGTITNNDPNSLLYDAGLIYGEPINYETIKNLFSWLDKSFKPILFIDKRNNNKLDANDIIIPFT